MSEPALPVTVPSTSTSLTKAQVDALADYWVSEHNRLPFQLSSDDHLAPPAARKQVWANEVFNFWPFNIEIVPRRPGDPVVQASLSLSNLVFRLWAWARRRIGQRRVAREFAVPPEVERRLRDAFARAIGDLRVQAMTDKDQRAHLGDVLWAALENERPE